MVGVLFATPLVGYEYDSTHSRLILMKLALCKQFIMRSYFCHLEEISHPDDVHWEMQPCDSRFHQRCVCRILECNVAAALMMHLNLLLAKRILSNTPRFGTNCSASILLTLPTHSSN